MNVRVPRKRPGSPLTAHDVKFSYDLFMEQGLESYRMAAGGFVTDVEVLDDHRIKFTFAPDSPVRDRIPVHVAFQSGFCVFVLSNYMKTIPMDLTEVAPVTGDPASMPSISASTGFARSASKESSTQVGSRSRRLKSA